MQKLMD